MRFAVTIPFLLLPLLASVEVPGAEPFEESNSKIVAHRGLLKHAPENTLANFRACLELGIGFEFDVEKTKDGVLVCIHDNTLDRTTNGTGPVSEKTLSEIQTLDAGSWFSPQFANERVPTIDQVLKLVAQHSNKNILIAVDLKADGVERDVIHLAEKHQVLHRLLFIGKTITSPEIRQNLIKASSNVDTAAVANNEDEFQAAFEDTHATWVYFRFLPTLQQIQKVHDSGKKSFIAGPTVSGNVPENWNTAIRAGLDGILTDYPLELANLLRINRK